MNDLLDKAWKVINSCETAKQARGAMRYLDLLANTHPELDVSPLRKEIYTLFEFK
jgi:SLT domain-containing protein